MTGTVADAARPDPFARLPNVDRAFETAFATPVAFLTTTAIAGLLIAMLLRAALVLETRFTGWVRSIMGPNGRYLFIVLLVAWVIGM